jgi:dipeptidyl aminopeptidase/acylaminoacyl peptidase
MRTQFKSLQSFRAPVPALARSGAAPIVSTRWIALAVWLLHPWLAAGQAPANIIYQKPPQEILDLADVERPPIPLIDPANRYLVLLRVPAFRSLSELAQPELRLAGLRINPKNHDSSRAVYGVGAAIQEIATGRSRPVSGLPASLRIEHFAFSPKGKYWSFIEAKSDGLTLWVVDLNSGAARPVTPNTLSASMGNPYLWDPDETSVYCRVRANLGPVPDSAELPTGPTIQESTGKKAPGATYEDLLKNKSDEERFEHVTRVEVRRFKFDGSSELVLPAGLFRGLELSPDGKWLLVEEIEQPYSYFFPYVRFPYRAYITDRDGKTAVELAKKPLLDSIPITHDAVESGRRDFSWREDVPAAVVFAEAQDGGDPAKEAAQRDYVYQLAAPFTAAPRLLCATTNRFSGIAWGDPDLAIVSDSWWKNRNSKIYQINPSGQNLAPKVLFDYSDEDLYHLPGQFATARNDFGRNTLLFSKDRRQLYLTGEGYSPEGNRPFLNEFSIASGNVTHLWRADGVSTYESVLRILNVDGPKFLTVSQSQTQFPNLFVRDLAAAAAPAQITAFANPFKSFEGVTKQKIHYRREDGVDLSADLYLPKGYDSSRDGRLPLLMEAYPTEFKDAKAAGMVSTSPHRFVYLNWASPVFWAVRGYAVLEGAQFPIVGQGKEEPNDTYIEQLVADARAAIKAVDDMGVVDPKRAGVLGHSYGAFMVVNLLAHSDLFAAGIARSGAYNRSLTPFGFQNEERNYWEAQPVYLKMSPFNYADKIKGWLLLIHGEADNNSGTFPLQSERLFQAVKGLGGHARLVMLPYESHGYAARENVLHVLWEEDTWLEKHVKNAKR